MICGLGAVWRLGYLLVVTANDGLLLNDSIYYSIQAGLNSEGRWFQEALSGQPGAEHGPLTSLYLTPWSLGGGDSVVWQRFAITLLGIATVPVVGLLARRAMPWPGVVADRAALVAAGIAAAYPNLWINDSLVMSETPAMLLVALTLLVTIPPHPRPGGHRRPGGPPGSATRPPMGRAAVVGVLGGLAALTRSELVLLVPGLALLMIARPSKRRVARGALMVVVATATLAPWTIYNLARFDEPVLLSTNDGTTWLGANCDEAYHDDIGGWDVRCVGALEVAELPADPSVRSRQRRDAAFDYVGDHLGRLPVVVVARVGRLLDVYGLGSMVDMDGGEEKAPWAAWAGIFCWWGLAVGAAVGWRDLARARAASRWFLVLPVATALLTAMVFYGAHRIRAPAEPAVVVLAAVAIAHRMSGSEHDRFGRSC